MKIRAFFQILMIFFILLVLISCSKSAKNEVQVITVTEKMTRETMLDSENKEIATQIPIIDPTSLRTSVPLTTRTYEPTLTSQEKINRIFNLEKNNGGCEYPCWWGIMPGVTSWQDAEKVLRPIAKSNLAFRLENNQRGHTLEFAREDNIFSVRVIENIDKIVDVIRLSDNLPLNEFLQKYGKPDEIRISSDGMVPELSIMRIVLLYYDIGIMRGYLGESKIIRQGGLEYLQICANDFWDTGPISLWNPKSKSEFEEVPVDNIIGGAPTNLKLVKIEDYTNYDLQSLYSAIINNSKQACIETKASIWPNPNRHETMEP